MGNLLGCGGSWSCSSPFQRKKKTENQIRQLYKQQQQQQRQQQQNGTKGPETPENTYERVFEQLELGERSQSFRSEESNLHYADIQVYSQTQSRSAWEVKNLQLENATEYATLRFPQITARYDSKNGTLV
ncbi:uncharacterized protein C11orf52 homolog [Orycteropus afer afer]|uniref:Uncharacterized protein C11orf52 homolog n=1 Tax=Orycteropus afer afer TaxID=1230840 RepID=A0A8B6ZGL6_ORYAF|nr:uncharacterized protein C11orf52 homolog [Orycteropus afer afer]